MKLKDLLPLYNNYDMIAIELGKEYVDPIPRNKFDLNGKYSTYADHEICTIVTYTTASNEPYTLFVLK